MWNEQLVNALPNFENFFLKWKAKDMSSYMATLRKLNLPNQRWRTATEILVFLLQKRGRSTGVTFGTTNEILSVVRRCSAAVVSKELWILSSIWKPFSEEGDSGSAVFDLKGRIAGMMTSRIGLAASADVTYATPIDWLLRDINDQLKDPVHVC